MNKENKGQTIVEKHSHIFLLAFMSVCYHSHMYFNNLDHVKSVGQDMLNLRDHLTPSILVIHEYMPSLFICMQAGRFQ